MEDTITAQERDPIDIHVGGRIAALRRERRISQKRLAAALGVSYQQVQKYENGSNRVAASMLWKAGRTLDVSIDAFYEGMKAK